MENYTEKIRQLVQSMDSENIQLAIQLTIDVLGWDSEKVFDFLRRVKIIYTEEELEQNLPSYYNLECFKVTGICWVVCLKSPIENCFTYRIDSYSTYRLRQAINNYQNGNY